MIKRPMEADKKFDGNHVWLLDVTFIYKLSTRYWLKCLLLVEELNTN